MNGYQQDAIDGISMVYTFANPDAQGQKQTQYFDNNGSRGIYHKGWYAGTFGPVVPWQVRQPDLSDWDAREDQWELYNLNYDFSQSQDLAVHYPEKVKQMRELFIQEAKEKKVFPIGAALLTRIDSSTRIESPYRSWVLDQTTRRMPEFAAPGLGRHSNIVVLDVDIDSHASGVLYALGGYSGGLCLFLEKGKLVYEYNMLLKDRYRAESERVLSAGSHQIEVETRMVAEPGGPATVVVRVDGEEVAKTVVKETVAVAFTASETLDIGIDLGSPVTESYFDQSPYPLEGSVKKVTVDLL